MHTECLFNKCLKNTPKSRALSEWLLNFSTRFRSFPNFVNMFTEKGKASKMGKKFKNFRMPPSLLQLLSFVPHLLFFSSSHLIFETKKILYKKKMIKNLENETTLRACQQTHTHNTVAFRIQIKNIHSKYTVFYILSELEV